MVERKETRRAARIRTTLTIVFAVMILIPSMMGFTYKFMEFIDAFRSEADGAFTITPMMNYLLASIGFASLMIWAAANGTFSDIEQPKYTMLETNDELDKS